MEAKLALMLLTALWSLLLLYMAFLQIPLIGALVSTLIPLPIILVSRRAGWWSGFLLVLVASGAILYLQHLFQFTGEIFYFLELALIGLLLAFLSGRGYPAGRVIGLTVVPVALIMCGVLLGKALAQGLSPLALLTRTVQEFVNNFLAFLQKEGISSKNLLPPDVTPAKLTQLLVHLSPALLLINTTLVVWLNLILSRLILPRAEGEEQSPPLHLWKSPEWLVFIALAAGFGFLSPLGWLQQISLNVLLVCGLIYFYQGLAIIVYVYQRWQVPRVVRFLSYPLIVLEPTILLLIVIGLADLWLDFRRLQAPPSRA